MLLYFIAHDLPANSSITQPLVYSDWPLTSASVFEIYLATPPLATARTPEKWLGKIGSELCLSETHISRRISRILWSPTAILANPTWHWLLFCEADIMKITEIRVHLGIGKGVFTGTQLLPFMDLGKRVFGNWDREFPRCEVMSRFHFPVWFRPRLDNGIRNHIINIMNYYHHVFIVFSLLYYFHYVLFLLYHFHYCIIKASIVVRIQFKLIRIFIEMGNRSYKKGWKKMDAEKAWRAAKVSSYRWREEGLSRL